MPVNPAAVTSLSQGDVTAVVPIITALAFSYTRGHGFDRTVVTITGTPTGGNFTLTFKGATTTAIAHNATAATVQAALEALAAIGAGNVLVTGGPGPGTPFVVKFTNLLGATTVPKMIAAHTFTGGTNPSVTAEAEPNADIAAVITTAAVRLHANTTQLGWGQDEDGISEQWRHGFDSWTLAEQFVLNRYRKRAM